jgi:PKHD-type hydroxylase
MDIKLNVNPTIFSVSTELPPLICDAIRDWESLDETDKIIEYAHAKVNDDKRDSRSSMVKWIHESNWLPSVLLAYVANINRRYFGYELVGYDNETVQFTKYGVGDYYEWHMDEDRNPFELMQNNSGEFVRKLSYTFQLSDPSEYEGGVLEFQNPMNTNEIKVIEKKQGLLTVFDSRVPHRVTEVTSGTRYSLVGWIKGGRFS